MKSDIYSVTILTQPKRVKESCKYLRMNSKKMGHDLGTCSPFFFFIFTKQYCKVLNVVLDNGDVLYC